MEPTGALSTSWRQPVPAEPFHLPDDDAVPTAFELEEHPQTRYVGRLRLPIAGPYHPWARLYRLPDERLLWVVRLWERDRAVRRVVPTATLLAFARLNRFRALADRIRRLARRGRSGV